VERDALGGHPGGGETMSAMKEPRKCIKCQRWFHDSIFHPEGHYSCRWHDCYRINHVTRTAAWHTQPKSWWERFKERLAGQI
jgi:hypothetical protein